MVNFIKVPRLLIKVRKVRSISVRCLGFRMEISISKSCPLFSPFVINEKYKIINIKNDKEKGNFIKLKKIRI